MTNKQQEMDCETEFTELDEGTLEEVSGGGNTTAAIKGAYHGAKEAFKAAKEVGGLKAGLKAIPLAAKLGWVAGKLSPVG